MQLKQVLKIALKGLKTHKSRSALTILGIIIGITSIILMLSIGEATEKLILSEIGGFGAETIVIRPGKEPTGPSDFGDTLFSNSLKRKDIEALKRKGNVPDLIHIMPAVIVPGSISYGGETYRPITFGGNAEFLAEIFNLFMENGSLFGENEIRQSASVVVLGSKVKNELFGSSDAVGKNIKIKDKKFRIIGVFSNRGQVAFFNLDDIAIIPYTTAQNYLLNIDYFHEIMVMVSSPDVVERAVSDIKATIRESHGITDPDKDDFFVVTQQGMVNQIQSILGALTLFLSSIVAIALVVAGIGVMNIMLVSVTERTREIGLRKALGATNKDILNQFLLEAIILTGIGGVAGILIGSGISFLISFAITMYVNPNWSFTFPYTAAMLGLIVSVFTGLIFGIYPARQASKKSPIEALRYE